MREGGVGRSAKRKLIIVPWIWLSGEIQGLCDVESAGRHYRAGQVSCRRLGRPRGPVSVNSPLHQIKRINFLSSCDQQRWAPLCAVARLVTRIVHAQATTTLEEKRPKNPIEAPKLKGFHQRKLVIISRWFRILVNLYQKKRKRRFNYFFILYRDSSLYSRINWRRIGGVEKQEHNEVYIHIYFSSIGENICLFVRSDTKVQIPQCKSQPGGDFPKLFRENSVSGLSTRRSVAASSHCIDGKQPSILSTSLSVSLSVTTTAPWILFSFRCRSVNRTLARTRRSRPRLLLFLSRFLARGCLAIEREEIAVNEWEGNGVSWRGKNGETYWPLFVIWSASLDRKDRYCRRKTRLLCIWRGRNGRSVALVRGWYSSRVVTLICGTLMMK